MTYYRLYHIKHDVFADVDPFDAPNDVAAVEHAHSLTEGDDTELWCGARKVASMRCKPESPHAALRSGQAHA